MLAVALAALLSTTAPAQVQAQPTALTLEPVMARAVDVPPPAAMAGISVRLRCVADAEGQVGNCIVVQETRPGFGFGQAAIALMNGTQADPAWRQGHAGDATFEHTIEFTP